MKNKTLVIGAGEIGTSLGNVLSETYDVEWHDPQREKNATGTYKAINITYPYSDKFIDITREYIARFRPELVIIHSTVAPGTTEKLGKGVVHSPVNGKHPNLATDIKTFTKFIGADNAYSGYKACLYLKKANIQTKLFSSSRATEVAKILCTTRYGMAILEMKETIKVCEEYKVPFHEVYSAWNQAYNAGCIELGRPQFVRPVLDPMPGSIGGHCVINNTKLLKSFCTDLVAKQNKE